MVEGFWGIKGSDGFQEKRKGDPSSVVAGGGGGGHRSLTAN